VSSSPDDKTVSQSEEPFLDRWSRKKAEATREPAPAARDKAGEDKKPVPELPPVDTLTPDSDFRAFFHPKVDEETRRAALKKLFSDPRFNIMDGLDVYIDDYSKSEPIPAAMLAGLRQAQNILQWAKEDAVERRDKELKQAAEQQELKTPVAQATTAQSRADIPDAVSPAPRPRSPEA
jgi:hypothetical protein